MEILKTVEAVYIYIYIEGFNKIELCKHSEKPMLFRRI